MTLWDWTGITIVSPELLLNDKRLEILWAKKNNLLTSYNIVNFIQVLDEAHVINLSRNGVELKIGLGSESQIRPRHDGW